jgi:transposase-like protein
LIITDGCAGLAAALQTVYPGAPHQRCWVHKMRNIAEAVHRRDHYRVKQDAQKIYRAPSLAEARQAFRHFQQNWQAVYPKVARRLEKDLPDLLNFYAFPKHLWKKLRTTNAMERCPALRDPTPYPTQGGLYQRPERGPDYLCHLPPLQRRLAKPYPRAFYTNRLTSPY